MILLFLDICLLLFIRGHINFTQKSMGREAPRHPPQDPGLLKDQISRKRYLVLGG